MLARSSSATVLVLAIAVLCAGGVHGAYLEGETTPEEGPPIVRPVPPPLPPPEPRDPLAELIRRVRVREGYHYRGLTVFPLELSEVSDSREYLSLQEALKEGVLRVHEKGRGSVPHLTVKNTGREPVLMLAGEMLLGGRQNRLLRDDVLLPARSGPVEVPVYCIEQGRWSGPRRLFEHSRSVAPAAVRGSAQALRPQAEVWADVKAYQSRLEVESATGDLQAVNDSPRVRAQLKEYQDHVARHCWRPSVVGMVVARHGRVVGADIFCNAGLFRKHRDRLLESYAVDCLSHGGPIRGAWRHHELLTCDSAEAFLRRVLRAEHSWADTPGLGRLLRVQSQGATGSALVYRRAVVHTCLFSRSGIVRRAVPEGEREVPPPMPLPGPVR